MTITGDYLLFFLGLLALVLMGMSSRNILYALTSSFVWFALFLWLFWSSSPPLDVNQDRIKFLTWGFLVLTLMPWIVRMDTEIKNEARGKSGGRAWKEWGAPPREKEVPVRDSYRKNLRRRLSGR